MTDEQLLLVEVDRLCVGLFVNVDKHWTEHPLPFSSFLIRSQAQIDKLRELGLTHVHYMPARSECGPLGAEAGVRESSPPPRQERVALQQASLERCERQFSDVSKMLRNVFQNARAQPEAARREAEAQVGGLVGEVMGEEDVAIRLLSEKAGQEATLHPLNVMVLSVLLARALRMEPALVRDIGLGAMLHDIGKVELPDRVRWVSDTASVAERTLYRSHVQAGVNLGRRMSLPMTVLDVLQQHHENADGSGYPAGLRGEAISIASRVVSVVNHYDNLCNPANPAQAVTPHDALAWMFAKQRNAFDTEVLSAFIRMMGVYPPGSVLQLNDGRYAMSVSVNSDRPLKPRVLVYDENVAPEEALLLDLETQLDIGVQRSIKPLQLPRAVFDYLSPRKRMCYFFERSRSMVEAI